MLRKVNKIKKVSPQAVLVHGVIPPEVQDPALPLLELDEVPLHPAVWPVEVPVNAVLLNVLKPPNAQLEMVLLYK